MEDVFICPRCGNKDPEYIGRKNGKPYCRMCIGFHGEEAQKETCSPKTVILDIPYRLSKEQHELSERIIFNFKSGIDTLVYAVCGSGKTEISYGVLAYAMSKGMKVGFALPRRDVVIELYARLKSAFPKNKVIAVYGQHSETLTADCVVLTTHQIYRYPRYFDLIVMDEVDAFPFKGNKALINMFYRSLKGHCVMMSATPSRELIQEFSKPGHDIVSLRTRFHKKPIPVPREKIAFGPWRYWHLIQRLRRYQKEKKQCLVFVPTVEMARKVFKRICPFAKGGNYVTSKRAGRSWIIQRFKQGRFSYLVTTAVLERGVTIRNLQVIVFGSDSAIYDSASLIQIAGRAGRKADAPTGEVVFLASKVTQGMKNAIEEIERCNAYL